MPAHAYPDRRTARERDQDRRRTIAEDRRLAAEDAAARKAELERLERLRAAGTQTPETHPNLYRRIELDVHVEYLAGDIGIMSRTMKRIVDARRDAKAKGDMDALREADEEGMMLTEFMKRYVLLHMQEEDEQGGSGQYEKTRQAVGKAAQSLALRTLREAS